MAYYKCPSYDNTILNFPTIEDSISGSIVTFNTSIATQLFGLKVGITAQQASGTPTPSSPLAITGWDSVHVNYVDFNQKIRNGNFVDADDWTPYLGANGSISVSDNELTYTLLAVGTNNYANAIKNSYGSFNAGHKLFTSYDIYVSKPSSANINYISGSTTKEIPSGWSKVQGILEMGDSDKSISYWGLAKASTYGYQVGDTYKIKNVMVIDLTQAFGSSIADYLYSLPDNGLSIVKKLFYKDYYAYNVGGSLVTIASVNGDNYPSAVINLGQTIYGGYVDWKLGKGILDKAFVEYDGTEDWSIGADGYARINKPSDFPSSTSINVICNMAIKTTQTTLNVGEFRIGNTNLIINLGTFADVTELKTWLSSNNLQFLYPLATPIEIPLPATMPSTITGIQNWFADTGDILELQYIETVKEYLNKHNTI